jgi:hypothetical protein
MVMPGLHCVKTVRGLAWTHRAFVRVDEVSREGEEP